MQDFLQKLEHIDSNTAILFLFIGIIGTICFAFSGLPQAIASKKAGHANGVAAGTINLWLTGEIATLIYTLYFYPHDFVYVINYTFNAILVGIIFYYKYFGENAENKNN